MPGPDRGCAACVERGSNVRSCRTCVQEAVAEVVGLQLESWSGTNPTRIWIFGVHGIWVHDAGAPARASKRESIRDLLIRIRDCVATFQIMSRITIHPDKQTIALRLCFVRRTIQYNAVVYVM